MARGSVSAARMMSSEIPRLRVFVASFAPRCWWVWFVSFMGLRGKLRSRSVCIGVVESKGGLVGAVDGCVKVVKRW